MMGRDRRYGRANIKARVGIATAVLVGGGAIGVVALATSSHGVASAAQSASFSRFAGESEWTQLNSAMSDVGKGASQDAFIQLADMTQHSFSQTTAHSKTLDEQRGIVVLATRKFLILESANGSLHLWLMSGNTKTFNVANSTSATDAMTASMTASQQATGDGNMVPATALMAGSPETAAQMLTPSAKSQTVTVQVSGTDLTVTVTVTKNTATVSQTATTPSSSNPVWDPSTSTQSAWMTSASNSKLHRGDLALVVGTRSHGLLHAQIVLFEPLSSSDVGGNSWQPHPSASASPSATPSASPSASPSPSASATEAGDHW
jgi:hypothetical protein